MNCRFLVLSAVLLSAYSSVIWAELIDSNDGEWDVSFVFSKAAENLEKIDALQFKTNVLYSVIADVAPKGADKEACPESLTFDAEMPTHYHGMTTKSTIGKIENEHCRYTAMGILFQMAGDWRIHFGIRQGRVFTRASQDIVVTP